LRKNGNFGQRVDFGPLSEYNQRKKRSNLMSHPDPLHDYENELEDDIDMDDDDSDYGGFDSELERQNDIYESDDDFDDEDDSMDGDHESALASAGFGTDEDYGSYGSYGDDDFGGYGCDDVQPDCWNED
jgi:hypothetical protein